MKLKIDPYLQSPRYLHVSPTCFTIIIIIRRSEWFCFAFLLFFHILNHRHSSTPLSRCMYCRVLLIPFPFTSISAFIFNSFHACDKIIFVQFMNVIRLMSVARYEHTNKYEVEMKGIEQFPLSSGDNDKN